MLIELLVGLAVAAPSPDRLAVGLPAEVDIVGLAVGARPELLWQPFDAEGRLHLRAAAGLLLGREYLYTPVGLGARWIGRPERRWHPVGGLGLEQQNFWVTDARPVTRTAMAFDLGLQMEARPGDHIGLLLSPEFAFLGEPGPGLSVRVALQRDL